MSIYAPQWQKQFMSREERKRDEALCSHYRTIGIPAVAAAKRACTKNSNANGINSQNSLRQLDKQA